jgi:hypothetical protein
MVEETRLVMGSNPAGVGPEKTVPWCTRGNGRRGARMRIRCKVEADEWTIYGPKITDPAIQKTLSDELENSGPVIVQHMHYHGGTLPTKMIFENFQAFGEYLRENAYAGDAIDVWSFEAVCTEATKIVSAKCPDDTGEIPTGGIY